LVKAIFEIGENEDRVLTIVKGKFGLKNKNDAVNLVIGKYGEEILELKLRPEPNLKNKKSSSGGKSKNA
jgi:hypothetical protein